MQKKNGMSKRSHKTKRRVIEQENPASQRVEQVSVLAAEEALPTGVGLPRSRWRHAAFLALLLGVCVGLYGWTADFPMVFDDHTYMIDNPFFQEVAQLKYLRDFEEFANRPARIGSDPDYAVNLILRPVTYATFYVNHLLDGWHPRWFRVVNLLIHACNSMLAYLLLLVVLRKPVARGMLPSSSALFIAGTAALLFAVHPLATESVTYIIQRFTSLVMLFSLLALWLHFLSLDEESSKVRRWALRIGSVVTMLLAMQSKENSVVIPVLAVLIDWLTRGTNLRRTLKHSLPLLLCLPLIPLLVFLTSAAQHGWDFGWHAAVNIVNSRDEPLKHWHYLVTQFTVVAHYLRLMVWPSGQNIDPEWPSYDSLWQEHVLASLGVLCALLALTWWMFRRGRGTDVRSALGWTFTLWFFAAISISSGVVPLPDMMAEHRSYMASLGIFILAACLLDRLRMVHWRQGVMQKAVPALVLVAAGALAWATCARNEVWRTNESLWQDTVAKSPNKYRTWGNLGTAYSRKGKDEKAVVCYRKALEIEPRFQNGLLNLSNSLLRLKRPKESLETTLQLIKIDQGAATKPPVAFTLGLGLAGVGRYDEAVSVFREILAVMPNDVMTLKALGLVYFQTGLERRALELYNRAAKIQPNDPQLPALMQAASDALRSQRKMN